MPSSARLCDRPNWLPLPVGEGWGEGPASCGVMKFAQQKREENSNAARSSFHQPWVSGGGPVRVGCTRGACLGTGRK